MQGVRLSEALTKELQDYLKEILRAYNSAVPISRASGRTGQGFEAVRVDDWHGQIKGYAYSGVMEKGRQGGKVPKGFYYIIKEWAEAKGLTFNSSSDLNRFAYFTAQKIARCGTSLYRRGGRTDIFSEPLARTSQQLAKRLSTAFDTEINNALFTR